MHVVEPSGYGECVPVLWWLPLFPSSLRQGGTTRRRPFSRLKVSKLKESSSIISPCNAHVIHRASPQHPRDPCAPGRLYQVEYAMEAIGHAGTCLGVLAEDGVVLAAERKSTNKLLDEVIFSEKIYKLHE